LGICSQSPKDERKDAPHSRASIPVLDLIGYIGTTLPTMLDAWLSLLRSSNKVAGAASVTSFDFRLKASRRRGDSSRGSRKQVAGIASPLHLLLSPLR
jgi:hypothetical protein